MPLLTMIEVMSYEWKLNVEDIRSLRIEYKKIDEPK